MPLEAYLFFDGRCEEAVEFYHKAIGAELVYMGRYKDAPEMPPGVPPGFGDKIMHATLMVGNQRLMAADGCGDHHGFEGFSLSLTAADEKQAHEFFDALAEGGEVAMPLGKTFFAPCFGMVKDRFGVHWMVIVQEG